LFAWKLLLFWNRFSIPQVEGFEAMARDTPLARPPFWRSFAFLPLALFASAGACLAALRRRVSLDDAARVRVLLAAWAGAYAVSIALFFVTDRYRVPILPVLVLLAACGVEVFLRELPPARRRRLVPYALAAAACFFVTSPEVLGVDLRSMRR